MVKVTIGGQVHSFDPKYPLSEAIELEEKLGIPFGEWQQAIAQGSAKAIAGYIWLVLRRNGKDVPLEDILSGEYPVDTSEINIEDEGGPAAADPPGEGTSPQEGGSTSVHSPKSSATPRPKLTGSRSKSSTTS